MNKKFSNFISYLFKVIISIIVAFLYSVIIRPSDFFGT